MLRHPAALHRRRHRGPWPARVPRAGAARGPAGLPRRRTRRRHPPTGSSPQCPTSRTASSATTSSCSWSRRSRERAARQRAPRQRAPRQRAPRQRAARQRAARDPRWLRVIRSWESDRLRWSASMTQSAPPGERRAPCRSRCGFAGSRSGPVRGGVRRARPARPLRSTAGSADARLLRRSVPAKIIGSGGRGWRSWRPGDDDREGRGPGVPAQVQPVIAVPGRARWSGAWTRHHAVLAEITSPCPLRPHRLSR
jgi:hypothetical protein